MLYLKRYWRTRGKKSSIALMFFGQQKDYLLKFMNRYKIKTFRAEIKLVTCTNNNHYEKRKEKDRNNR